MHLRARCFVDTDAPEAKQPGVEVFRTAEGVAATMAHPVVRAALHVLVDARPAALPFDALLQASRARLGGADTVSSDTLADAMLRCTLVRLIDLSADAPGSFVTSLLHLEVKLSPFDRFVLMLLDGSHDDSAIVDEVDRAVARGDLDLGDAPQRAAIIAAVGRAIQQLYLCGLMIA